MTHMKRRRISSEVSAGSMADIAFLLLIFFLVTTTIASDKGITFLLPPIYNTPPTPLSEDRVLTLMINGSDDILLEGEDVAINDVTSEVLNFLQNRITDNIQPVLSIQVDRESTYDVFISAYDAIKRAYSILRQEASLMHFQKEYGLLSIRDQRKVNKMIPIVISEAEPVAYLK